MKRIRIDRIDVDMRGVPPTTARAATRGLVAAIRRQLAARTAPVASTRTETTATATGLANRVARQVAGRIGRQR